MNYRRKRFRSKDQRQRASERARRGWETRRAKGTATWGARDIEPERIRAGELLGVLDWRGVDGGVKRLVVRQARRANSIRIDGMERAIGWDELFRNLRSKLAVSKKVNRTDGTDRTGREVAS